MQVEIPTSIPFPGWSEFNDRLAKLPAPELAVSMAKLVAWSAKRNDGRFVSEGFVNSINHQIFQRLLLRNWSEQGWRMPTNRDFANFLQDDAAKRKVGQLMRALVGLRDQHPVHSPSVALPMPMKIASNLWLTAQEQRFQNRSPKHEVARAWLMFETIWPAVVQAHNIELGAPNRSAFESLPYALFMLEFMYMGDGWLPDVTTALSASKLQGLALTSFLECYTMDAREFVRLDRPQEYPTGIVNPFGLNPVLRITDNVLFAPDPSVIFGGLGFRLLQQALTAGTAAIPEDPQEGFKQASSAFGFVFEDYGRLLLSSFELSVTGDQYLPEFSYRRGGNQVASPDAFLTGPDPLIFEFKSLRFPFDAEAAAHFTGFASWLTRMTGGKDGRTAFEQGAEFVRDARAGLFTEVDRSVAESATYVIVGYEDIPLPANWPAIRRHVWSDELSPEASELATTRAVFISIRDLEVALTVSEYESNARRSFSLGSAIKEWWRSLQTGPAAFEDASGQRRLAPDFGNYLLEKYPDAAGYFPRLLREAWDAFQDKTMAVGFDDETAK